MAERKIEKKVSMDRRNEVVKNVWVPNPSKKIINFDPYEINGRKLYVLSEKMNLADIISGMADEANDVICISSFLIEDSVFTDSLLRAANRGVRVYLLTAKEEELKADNTEFDDEGIKKEIIDAHKALLDKISGRILVRTSPDFHSKFVLFDPKSKNSQGILTTSNLVKGAMMGQNLEVSIELTKDEIKSYFVQFVRGFWNEAKHEKIDETPVLKHVPKATWDIDVNKISHPCTCSNVRSLRNEVLRLIESAKKELTVSAWTFEKEHASTEAIKNACKRGVRVKILSRDDPRSVDNIYALLQSGAEVYSFNRRVHAKFIISDNEALMMTSNFSTLGLDSGFESGILFNVEESRLFRNVAEDLFSNCSKQLMEKVRLGDLTEEVHLRFDSTKRDNIKFTPESKQSFDLGEKRVKNNEIDSYDPKDDLLQAIGNRLIKEIDGTIILITEIPEEKKKKNENKESREN